MHEAWDKFVASHPLGTIHQTSFWGEFQARSTGRDKYFIVALESQRNPRGIHPRPPSAPPSLIAGGLFIRHKLPFGLSWLYCPRGPLCDYSKPAQLQSLMKKLAPIAKKERAVFVRIDPPILSDATQNFPTDFRTAHAQYQPQHTLVIDLSQTEEQILAQMKPKGRYNIKVAQKHGVIIRIASPPDQKKFQKDFSDFYEILAQTASRDKFHIHPKSYYKNMLAVLSPQNMAALFLAEYKNKIIAGIIVTYFAPPYFAPPSPFNTPVPTYYFGASDYEYRNLMAPYLLQWEAIREARRLGYKFYDFLGIAPLDKSGAPIHNHPYSRITDFKLKFGGRRIQYAPAKEFVFKPIWYRIIKLAKKLI